MTENEQQIHEIEVSMEEARKVRDLGEAYKRLLGNSDFKLVVNEEYFRNEAARLTLLTAEPNFNEKRKQDVMYAIRGIGEFRQFLMLLERQAEMAREAIHQAETALMEIDNGFDPDQEH